MELLTVHLTRETDDSLTMAGEFRDWQIIERIAPDAFETVRLKASELTRRFKVDREKMVEMGEHLRQALLRPVYEGVLNTFRPEKARFLITSPQPEILQLPWELLPGPEGGLLVESGRWTILRCARKALLPPAAGISPPPLRVLFCACAPTDAVPLDYEAEEEAMVRLAHQLKGHVRLDIAETGSFEEACQRVADFKPQILHLSGHCKLKGRMGHFGFENERGLSSWCPSPLLAEKLLFEKGIRLLLITTSVVSHPGASALCNILAATHHVPCAIAWAARLSDAPMLPFMRAFLHELIHGRSVEKAISEARHEFSLGKVSPGESERGDLLGWQAVYSAEDDVNLVDRSLTPELVTRPVVRYELLGDNIAGLREGFVGRRRLLQHIRPAMRKGEKRLVFLTGINGSGRTTLASRLAILAKEEGYAITGVQARPNDGWQLCLRLLGKLATTCEQMGRAEEKRVLSDGQRSVTERLQFAVELLNQAKILLVLDNLEELLPPPPLPAVWIDPDFALFFQDLISRLSGEGRVIATCSRLPSSLEPLPSHIGHEILPEFSAINFLKFILRDEEVGRLMESGRLSYELVHDFYQKLGITPRFVKQACAVLAKINPGKLAESLKSVPVDLSATQQQIYFRDLFLADLYRIIPPEFRLGLCRTALVEMPLPIDGVARVSGIPRWKCEEALTQWSDLGLIMHFSGAGAVRLYGVHSLQREFFLHPKQLPAQEAKIGHEEASAFLQECFEVNREDEMRWSITAELMACLHHATAAGNQERRRWAALRLSRRLQGKSEYRAALELIEPIVKDQGELLLDGELPEK